MPSPSTWFKSNYILLIIITYLFVSSTNSEKDVVNVYAISNLQITYGRIIVAAQKLAFEYINEHEADLLSNYTLNLTLLDAEEDTTVALQHVLDLIDKYEDYSYNNDTDNIRVLPIILGCPYSSLSSITAPALAAINWAQISSLATSISLSDTGRYPTFYRTIAADSLQAAGIIGLLEHFNWNKFGIIYVNDVYGIYLTIEIMRLASIHKTTDFQVSPIAYTTNDRESIEFAINQLKNTDGAFITLLIVHDADINPFFTELDRQGIWGYPYFYLGVDAWFDDTVIKLRNLKNYTQGYMGTAPWGSHMLSYSSYNNNLQSVYNLSVNYYKFFNELWLNKSDVDSDFLYNITTPSALSNYGWDTAYTAVNIMQKIIEYNETLDHLITTPIDLIDDIITNQINFVGITGNVSYKDNGDRDQALFSYGNILENGSIQWVGYFSDYYNVTELNVDSIIWPDGFTERDMIPRSSVQITDELITISPSLFITFVIFASISIIIVIIYISLTIYYADRKIMRAASWRLNIVSCIGCIICYIYIIISGLPNESDYSHANCSIQPWLLSISFTLLFMPLFLKTYRISIIFSSLLKKITLTDTVLLIIILICLLFDILILTIFTSISPLIRHYKSGNILIIDPLQHTQYLYATCESSSHIINYTFLGILGIYKLLQLLFGIYCCLIVSRIGVKEIRKFDETSTQLIAIVISISLLFITIIIVAFIPQYQTNLLYAISSSIIIIISNICLSFNLLPRFIAIYKKNEEKYKNTPQEEIKQLIQEKLKDLFTENGIPNIPMDSFKPTSERAVLSQSDVTITPTNNID